ncbi:MAG: alpha-ketoglutarate-dependent dioxygenase AlkB family protein [Pontibacterium sp.]
MKQLSLSSAEKIQLDEFSFLHHVPDFVSLTDADATLITLSQEIQWRADSIRIYGRQCLIPRLQQYQAEQGFDYCYSGLTLAAMPFHPAVDKLRKRLRAHTDAKFNAVLLNYYRDGRDNMGWHSDDEASLGTNPVIASVSFGESRRFILRDKNNHSNKFEIALGHGSLLLMEGETQTRWQHAIAKTAKPVNSRINLTFRQIMHQQTR